MYANTIAEKHTDVSAGIHRGIAYKI